MFIPTTDLCPSKIANSLLKRDLHSYVVSTSQSFKSWDTCMDNKTCKIVAIVGIVLAALVGFWIIATFIRCCCLGFSCLEALCCCCCRSASRPRQANNNQAYSNPNMYPVYQTRQMDYHQVHNDENPFNERTKY